MEGTIPRRLRWTAASLLLAALLTGRAAQADSPSFDCAKAVDGSIEKLVCSDAALSSLDRKLAEVYAAATRKAVNEHPPTLKAEQIGWIRGRNDCWKSDDRRSCVEAEYRQRIASLQARYRLVAGTGPVTFFCDGDRRNELVVTFFATDPKTLIAERGDATSLMYLEPAGAEARYVGRNETFTGTDGTAVVTWGYGAPPMRCQRAP
jgi:uncharacterized protein